MNVRARMGEKGFSLLEVVAASVILTLVLTGLSSVLTGYSKTRTSTVNSVVGRNIAASILDEILLHHLIENSLISDTENRSRSTFLPARGMTVSKYFFWCFPGFPADMTHNTPEQIWNATNVPKDSVLTCSIIGGNATGAPGRLYGAGGNLLAGSSISNPEVKFIARISVLGSDRPDLGLGSASYSANLGEFINGKKNVGGTTYSTGEFLDTDYNQSSLNTSKWCWILDTYHSGPAGTRNETSSIPYEVANFGTPASSPLNELIAKVIVVRIYNRSSFVEAPPTYSLKGKPRVAESYKILGGQVRI